MPTPASAQTFNSLPRPLGLSPSHPPSAAAAPYGTPTHTSAPTNHWHISLRTLPLSPPGDLLFIIQPSTGYIHCEGPTPTLTLGNPQAQAQAMVPLLLKAFNRGLGGYRQDNAGFAPGSWSTGDAALADALGREMKRLGVRKECRVVGVAGGEEERKVGEEWGRFKIGLNNVTRG